MPRRAAAARACRRSSSTTPPRTAPRRSREAHGAKVIRNARNEGYGRANNIGARAAGRRVPPHRQSGRRAGARRGRGAPRRGAGAIRRRGSSRRASSSPTGRVFFQPRSLLAPYLDEPARRPRPAGGRCLRAVPVGRLLPDPARRCSCASAASTRTSSCSTRTTISAAASPRRARPSSMCPTRSSATGAAGRARSSPAGSSGRAGTRPGRAPM